MELNSGSNFGSHQVVLLLFGVKNGLLAQLLARSAEHLANLEQFLTFCTLPGTTSAKTIPSLAHIWCLKPYP